MSAHAEILKSFTFPAPGRDVELVAGRTYLTYSGRILRLVSLDGRLAKYNDLSVGRTDLEKTYVFEAGVAILAGLVTAWRN